MIRLQAWRSKAPILTLTSQRILGSQGQSFDWAQYKKYRSIERFVVCLSIPSYTGTIALHMNSTFSKPLTTLMLAAIILKRLARQSTMSSSGCALLWLFQKNTIQDLCHSTLNLQNGPLWVL